MIIPTVHATAVSITGVGAQYVGSGRCSFRVWAPSSTGVAVELYTPTLETVTLTDAGAGFWAAVVDGVRPGARYKFRLDDSRVFADPASRSQPEGVHGPSEVVDHDFAWTDTGWRGLPIEDYVLYELHVGTFSAEGTFDGVIPHLQYLNELGVTAIEVMPVAQFPGARNWGYDGVYPFAVQNSYGGVQGLKRLVDAAHRIGIAVILDVVYNHLGPEGNYLGQFGPYFTDRYHTPWGCAVNFDGEGSAAVREYVVQNALYWVELFHMDGLRLDAVHAIHDHSETHILQEIAAAVHRSAQNLERTVTVVAESDLNEARIVRAAVSGGYNLDAQWSDDFHHALHTVLTGERTGYYEDFGHMQDLAKALGEGFVYSGQYSPQRGRCHGTVCTDVPGHRFVVCSQNHDQVGNRMMGERLSHLIAVDDLKLAASVLLLSPYVPLLFMGQEYAETAPFLYFVSHSDPDLVEAVRKGRKREFASFAWRGEVPDPQAEETFLRSKLNHDLRITGWHAVLLDYYKHLLQMRRTQPALARLDRDRMTVDLVGDGHTIAMHRWTEAQRLLSLFNFGTATLDVTCPAEAGTWNRLLDSADIRWMGTGSDIPPAISSDGTISVALVPKQCLVLARQM